MQVWIRRFALLLLPLGFLAVMVAAPLLSLAFYDGEGAWAEVVADDYMRLRLGWTVAQAVLTCVLVTALGVPAAWVLARMDFAGRRTVLRLLMLPFVMPTLVAGMGVLALFGAHGMLGGRLAGHAVAADLRQRVFQPAGFGALGVSGICACAAGAVAVGTIFGRGRVAAVCLGRMAGGARVGCRWCVSGIFILFFRLRAGLAARRRTFCNSGSGNLPAGGVRVGHGACVGIGVAGAGGYGGGRRFVCVLEQTRGCG